MAEMTYRFTSEAFIGGQSALKNADSDIETELRNVEAFASSQMGTWNDTAKNQYQEHKAQWDAAIAEMKSVLSLKAAPALQRIQSQLEDTERINQSMWAQ